MDQPPYSADHRAKLIALEGCHNLRSVAGWRARDGRSLTAGKLYRSDGLDQLSPGDQTLLAGLGLRHAFDLRASAEIARAPSRWPDTMHLRIWAGAESAAEADITALMKRGGLDAGAFSAAMCAVYARFPEDLAQAVRAMGNALLADDAQATLVHCTAGKDRTGFAVAMLLHAIGITADEVMAEYLLSNASFAAARVRFNGDGRFDALEANAPGAVAALVGVHPEYLGAAERRIADDFGGIDAWLEHQAGLDPARREQLANRLLG